MKYISLIIISTLTFSACELPKTQAQIDDEIINNYLADNNLEAEYHESGLYYNIVDEGTDGHPELSSVVEVSYKGYLTSNQVFDQTTGDETVEFALAELIKGWQIGIPLLQKGGSGIFYVPSALGYGGRTVGSIPANSVLIFEIELVDFY